MVTFVTILKYTGRKSLRDLTARPVIIPGTDKMTEQTKDTNGKKHLLLVDDEPNIREMITLFLSAKGYDVDIAENGEEAIEKITGSEFDLILTDINMPGMDGIEFYKKLKEMAPELAGKIIFMTGYLKPEWVRYVKDSGCPLLTKPFTMSSLSKTLLSI